MQVRLDFHEEITNWYSRFKAQHDNPTPRRGTRLNSGLAFAETALPTKWQQTIDTMPGLLYDDQQPSVMRRVYTSLKPKLRIVVDECAPPTNLKAYPKGVWTYMLDHGQMDIAVTMVVAHVMPETYAKHSRGFDDGLPFISAPIEHYIVSTVYGAGFFNTTWQVARYYIPNKVVETANIIRTIPTQVVETTNVIRTAVAPTLETTGTVVTVIATPATLEIAAPFVAIATTATLFAIWADNVPIDHAATPEKIITLMKANRLTLDQASFSINKGEKPPYMVFYPKDLVPSGLDDQLNQVFFQHSNSVFHISIDDGSVKRLLPNLTLQAPQTWCNNLNLVAPPSKKPQDIVVQQNQMTLMEKK